MKHIIIYTDGACSYNPGPGGWGAVLIYGNYKKEISGYQDNTTNNRMEMTAVIKALSTLKENCEVELYSDSAYVINAFKQNWISQWEKSNWKNSNKKDVLNRDLWEILCTISKKHKISWNKVKGHADNELNNRCDTLARNEILKNQ